MTTRARAQADAAAACVLYPQYTSMDAVLLDGPGPPAPAPAPKAAAAPPPTEVGPPAPRKSKAKRKKAAAAEGPAGEEQPSTAAAAAPATPAAGRDGGGGGGAPAAEASPPAPGSTDAPSAAPSAAKKPRKKKKGGAGAAAALPSGPGNADEAARIRSALGFDGGEAPAAAAAAAAAAAPAPVAEPGPVPTGTFAFGFSGGDGATPAVIADGGVVDAAAAAAAVRSTALPPPPPRPASTTAPAHPGLARRVFVGGMPFGYEEADVREYWEWCGPVSSLDLMRFPDTGRFRGIAFITFATEDGYVKALECDGTMLDGVRVKVEPCKKGAAGGGGGGGPRRGHGGQGAGGGGAAAAPKVPGYNVAYVGNIAFEAGPDDVAALFAECGSGVSRVRLHTDRLTGASKGYAHVHFRDEAGLDAALAIDGVELCGRPVRVGYAQPKAGGGES